MDLLRLFVFICSFSASFILVQTKAAHGEEEEEDENDPYKTTDPKKREPSPCEICKFFATELESRLQESAGSKEVLEMGQWEAPNKKRVKYLTSELRLTEALHEPHVCEKILEYNVHAERKGSLRYGKGMSETMKTLHGLVNKGVKVELGIPYDLWDKPSAEVSKMHRACFTFAERFEEDIETWYYQHQHHSSLLHYLCSQKYLKNKDQSCLQETLKAKGDGGLRDAGDGDKDIKNNNNNNNKNNNNNNDNNNKNNNDNSNNKFVTPSPMSTADYPGEIPKPPRLTTLLPASSRQAGEL